MDFYEIIFDKDLEVLAKENSIILQFYLERYDASFMGLAFFFPCLFSFSSMKFSQSDFL